jgi:cation diffusion facilitator family transporter
MLKKTAGLKKGQQVAGIAMVLESVLTALKALIGFLSGSLVLISDAIHSGADILSIAASYFGLKIADKKADAKFPYGYYKAENLGALLISFLIFYGFWQMITRGFSRLFSFSDIQIPILALAVSFIDALVLFFFGNYEIKVGKKINAQSLVAMGQENKTHLFSSLAVFTGTLAAFLKIPYIEGAVTIIISFLILKIGFQTFKNAILALMDVSPGKDMETEVKEVIRSVPGIEECISLRLRKSGPFVLGEAKVGIRRFVDVKKAHQTADKVEAEIKSQFPFIESFMVHVEPFKSSFKHLIIPVKNKKDLDSAIASTFARAPYFLFLNLKGKKVKGYYFLKNSYKNKKQKAGLGAAKLAAAQKSEVVILKEIGEIAFYTLKDNLFDIYQTKKNNVKKAVDEFLGSGLKILNSPSKKV